MAEVPTDSGDEETLVSIVEGDLEKKDPSDITPEDQHKKFMDFLKNMNRPILDKIEKNKSDGVINEPDTEYDQAREEVIHDYAKENPDILDIWDKIKPKETVQERMKNLEKELQEKSAALTDDELEELINPAKKSPSMPRLEGNISNINTPKMQTHLEKKSQQDSFFRVRDAIAPYLDKKGLELFNEAIEREMES
jgi:hypothetical protein